MKVVRFPGRALRGWVRSVPAVLIPVLAFLAACASTESGGPSPAIVVDTGASDSVWQAAMAAYLAGDFERAVLEFSSFADKHPGSARAPEAPYWRGLALVGAGHPEKGLGYLQTALREGAGIIPFDEREKAVERARGAIARGQAAMAATEEVFWLQAGAFSKQENADALIERLQGLGFRSKRVELQRGAGTLHAVRVGPVSGSREAEAVKLRLEQEAQISGAIVMQE